MATFPRLGKVRVMATAFTLCALGTFACAFVPNAPGAGIKGLILLRFLTGIAAAAMIPLSIAYIGDKFPPEKRQATLGQFMSALDSRSVNVALPTLSLYFDVSLAVIQWIPLA